MRVLITGGAGFIGGHLAEKLLVRDVEVSVIDNLSTGKESNVPPGAAFFHAYCQDIRSLQCAAKGCDFVYHLASTVGVDRVTSYPRECIDNNIDAMRAVASLRLPGIFTSTSEVYGKNIGALREGSDMILSERSRWSYAASKLVCEWLAIAAGMGVVRLFNVVGPRQSLGYVFSNFVASAVSGEPLVVHGNGKQTRTFIDVRDAVCVLDGLGLLLQFNNFKTVNIGGIHSLSVEQLAREIKETLKSSSPIVRRSYEDAYPKGFEECPARVPDLSLLNSLVRDFHYRPLDETILATAAACK